MIETDLKVISERDVPVSMRDGTILRADIIRPAAPGRYPVLLHRTPYGKGGAPFLIIPEVVASQGYVVIDQDVRGRFASEGEFAVFQTEELDGYDTVEWAAVQPWSNGRVGMYGGSYMGAAQLLAAAASAPHLMCLIPSMTGSDYYDGWTHRGGAFNLSTMLAWSLLLSNGTAQRKGLDLSTNVHEIMREIGRSVRAQYKGDNTQTLVHNRRIAKMLDSWYRRFPLKDMPMPREAAPYFFEWLDNRSDGEYWDRATMANRGCTTRTPAFHIGGWYDIFASSTITNYTSLRESAATEEARNGQRLMMGPWIHGSFGAKAGEMDFGPEAALSIIQLTELHLTWFDYWLKGKSNGALEGPPIRLFVLGRNVWRDEYEWPLARTRYVPYYAHGNGRANSNRGDGRLDPIPPGQEEPDSYVYEPSIPAPTLGGNVWQIGQIAGVRDQRLVEAREDVLVYTGDALKEDLEVTGPVVVELWAASSASDTDFTAKLVDVHPNGFAQNILDGILRARFRESFRKPRFIGVGEAVKYCIDLGATSNVFLAGHRIRLEISSSNFPQHDRNPNTDPRFARNDRLEIAKQMVFHESDRPTCVILPVIPRS